MNSKSGEAIVGLLVGLALGATMLYVNTGNKAQVMANEMGVEVSQFDVIVEEPGKSAATILLPAAAGWGVGFALDELSGKSDKSSEQNNNVRVNTEGDVNVSIIGNQDNDSSSTTRTDTRTEGSNNQ